MQDREVPMREDGPSTWESFKADAETFFAEAQREIAEHYPTLASLGFRYYPDSDDEDEDDDGGDDMS